MKFEALCSELEQLDVTQGAGAGEHVRLFPWQRRFLKGFLRPEVRTAALSMARGGGKSTFVAMVAIAHLIGPLARARGEILIVASSVDQGRIVFAHVAAFLKEKFAKSRRRDWKISDNNQRVSLEHVPSGISVRVLASDPRRAQGRAPSLILCDEASSWLPSTAEKMRSALETSLGKIPNSKMVAIGTRPSDSSHWFSRWLDGEADYLQSYSARDSDPPFQRKTWIRANPSLPFLPELEAAYRREADRAKRSPSVMQSFRSLRLNMGVGDVIRRSLLEADVWQSLEGDAPMAGQCVWGVDLGGSAAMSAVCGYWPSTGRLDVLAAFPTEPSLAERGLADAVGDLYNRMCRRGELVQTAGRVVDVSILLREAMSRFGPPDAVAADRWREAELLDGLELGGIPAAALVSRGQGFKDGAEDVRAFVRACLTGDVTPSISLLLRSAMKEATVVSDPAGNSKLAKSTEGGRRQMARDDAAAAAILAVAVGSRGERAETTEQASYAVV